MVAIWELRSSWLLCNEITKKRAVLSYVVAEVITQSNYILSENGSYGYVICQIRCTGAYMCVYIRLWFTFFFIFLHLKQVCVRRLCSPTCVL